MNVKPELFWILKQSRIILRIRFHLRFRVIISKFYFFYYTYVFLYCPPPPPKLYIYFYNFILNFFSFSFFLSTWEMCWVLKILDKKRNCSISERKANTILHSKAISSLFGISILSEMSIFLKIHWIIKC